MKNEDVEKMHSDLGALAMSFFSTMFVGKCCFGGGSKTPLVIVVGLC